MYISRSQMPIMGISPDDPERLSLNAPVQFQPNSKREYCLHINESTLSITHMKHVITQSGIAMAFLSISPLFLYATNDNFTHFGTVPGKQCVICTQSGYGGTDHCPHQRNDCHENRCTPQWASSPWCQTTNNKASAPIIFKHSIKQPQWHQLTPVNITQIVMYGGCHTE